MLRGVSYGKQSVGLFHVNVRFDVFDIVMQEQYLGIQKAFNL